MQAAKRLSPTVSPQSTLTSDSQADRQFFVSYGVIISARLADVESIRKAIEEAGGKLAFQTVTSAPLYLLRHYQVEQILQGDLSHLAEVHSKKSKERRVEK